MPVGGFLEPVIVRHSKLKREIRHAFQIPSVQNGCTQCSPAAGGQQRTSLKMPLNQATRETPLPGRPCLCGAELRPIAAVVLRMEGP
jgi:hypothetical protein